ncbi:MAG: hypothetical protein ACRCWI_02615 [Brevinema sp.]
MKKLIGIILFTLVSCSMDSDLSTSDTYVPEGGGTNIVFPPINPEVPGNTNVFPPINPPNDDGWIYDDDPSLPPMMDISNAFKTAETAQRIASYIKPAPDLNKIVRMKVRFVGDAGDHNYLFVNKKIHITRHINFVVNCVYSGHSRPGSPAPAFDSVTTLRKKIIYNGVHTNSQGYWMMDAQAEYFGDDGWTLKCGTALDTGYLYLGKFPIDKNNPESFKYTLRFWTESRNENLYKDWRGDGPFVGYASDFVIMVGPQWHHINIPSNIDYGDTLLLTVRIVEDIQDVQYGERYITYDGIEKK